MARKKSVNKQCSHVYKLMIAVILAVAGVLVPLGGQAHADSWMAYDESSGLVLSRTASNPTVLNQVTVVCPTDGYLVATGTSTARVRNPPGGTKAQGGVIFSISLDSSPDFFHRTVVLQNMGPDTLANIPSSLQRIDACDAGETLTYYHLAYGGGPEGIQVGIENVHKLVVQFFNQEL
jgi:hypothetical protein